MITTGVLAMLILGPVAAFAVSAFAFSTARYMLEQR